MKIGYAAITWGGRDDEAIDDIAAVGFKAIQLRASVLNAYAGRPAALRQRLRDRHLTFAVLSSGNLRVDPAEAKTEIELHTAHAAFVRDAGGLFLQVIDEKPKGRATEPDDYARLGHLLTEVGRRTAAIGVPLVYHPHMNSLSETPGALETILAAADPAAVSLIFDIAHYQQGGGDPIAAIRRHAKRMRAVHLKNVEPTAAAPGYRWTPLDRGRVDVAGCVTALTGGGFAGWGIVELDRVSDPATTPKAAAVANRDFLTKRLHLAL